MLMRNDDMVFDIIYTAIDEVNRQLSKERQVAKSLDAKLSEVLDSLGLINFVVIVEQSIQERLGISITLTDERAMSQTNSPFVSVKALAEFITALL